MILALAMLLLAAAPAAAPDLSWLIDAEIPGRIAAAQADATRLDLLASQSLKLREGVVARRAAALEEKVKLQASLAALSRGKKSDAEKRIVDLEAQAAAAETRAKQLAAEAAAYREQAASRRAFAAAAAAEARRRQADAAKNSLQSEADLGPMSDARLGEARAWNERLLARVPKQLAALEAELDQAASIPDRGAVVARKEAVRASAAASQAEIQRIADELSYRAESKNEEAAMADEMLAAARARASERESPEPVATATGPDAVDAMLDRVIAAQDRQAADAAAKSKSTATALRIGGAIGGLGALGATLYVVLRRMA